MWALAVHSDQVGRLILVPIILTVYFDLFNGQSNMTKKSDHFNVSIGTPLTELCFYNGTVHIKNYNKYLRTQCRSPFQIVQED